MKTGQETGPPEIDGLSSCCSYLFGLTQLEIFVICLLLHHHWKKTLGFALARVFEGMIESAPQSLLQLYIVLKRADGDTTILLLFASIGTSVLSMAVRGEQRYCL